MQVLALGGAGARVLAGGQTLIPQLRLGLTHPTTLVDINGIAGLDRLAEEDGALCIGALVRDGDLERSTLVRDRYPVLLETVRRLADPLTRGRSTMAGSLAAGDPASDWATVLAALDAEVHIARATGRAVVPARGFQRDAFATALRVGDLIVEIRIPQLRAGEGAAYVKVEQRAGDFAVTGAAVRVQLEGDVIRAATIMVANAAPTVLDAQAAAASLIGRAADDPAARAEAGRLAGVAASPAGDLRGTAEAKRELLVVLVRRALGRAVDRARAGAA